MHDSSHGLCQHHWGGERGEPYPYWSNFLSLVISNVSVLTAQYSEGESLILSSATLALGLSMLVFYLGVKRRTQQKHRETETDKQAGRRTDGCYLPTICPFSSHQGMDRPGICQVPEGSGEQGKMEETGC